MQEITIQLLQSEMYSDFLCVSVWHVMILSI